MEDLRRNKNEEPLGVESLDTAGMPNIFGGKSTSAYTNHLPRYVIPKKVKRAAYYLSIVGAVALVCIFPYEIGDTIGQWIYNFWTGLTHRF